MTNLKFRAYHHKMKKMLTVRCIDFHSKAFDCIDGDECFLVKFEDCEIMQSTGLTDKNGKEIFEGDICVDINQEEFVVNFSDEWSAFLLEKGKDTMVFYPGLQIEIIGNIHENPEIVNP